MGIDLTGAATDEAEPEVTPARMLSLVLRGMLYAPVASEIVMSLADTRELLKDPSYSSTTLVVPPLRRNR